MAVIMSASRPTKPPRMKVKIDPISGISIDEKAFFEREDVQEKIRRYRNINILDRGYRKTGTKTE